MFGVATRLRHIRFAQCVAQKTGMFDGNLGLLPGCRHKTGGGAGFRVAAIGER